MRLSRSSESEEGMGGGVLNMGAFLVLRKRWVQCFLKQTQTTTRSPIFHLLSPITTNGKGGSGLVLEHALERGNMERLAITLQPAHALLLSERFDLFLVGIITMKKTI